MEWHLSYHPLKESEIRDCYFAVLDNPTLERQVVQQYALDDASAQRLSEVYHTARTSPSTSFQVSHGFSLAIVAGLLRKYWYVHGSTFTSVVEKSPQRRKYKRLWKAMVPPQYQHGPMKDAISTHFSSGAYLSHTGLQQLRIDYAGDARLWAILEDTFSHGRLGVFWQAVDYALDHEMGLLEAADVIMPDPINLHNVPCHANALNCEQEGILLYQQTIAQQASLRFPRMNSTVEETTQTPLQPLYDDLGLPVSLR